MRIYCFAVEKILLRLLGVYPYTIIPYDFCPSWPWTSSLALFNWKYHFCFNSISFLGYSVFFWSSIAEWRKTRMTLQKKLVSFNKPNNHHLLFNLDPTITILLYCVSLLNAELIQKVRSNPKGSRSWCKNNWDTLPQSVYICYVLYGIYVMSVSHPAQIP